MVWIAYPEIVWQWNVQNILTYIAGNVFGMKEVKALKLLDAISTAMMEQYDGPGYTFTRYEIIYEFMIDRFLVLL